MNLPPPFIEAAHFTPAHRKLGDIGLVVLHSMESQEKPGTARGVSQWFTRNCSVPTCGRCNGPEPDPKKAGPRSSAGYCLDAAEIIQCVRDQDIAWAAPGANANGLHIEHAGRASQTPAEWDDVFSRGMLALSIELCAWLCQRWEIPAVPLDAAGLKMGRRGITTHAAVTAAFRKSTHTDPGPGFPLRSYVRRVAEKIRSGGANAKP